jgi:flagella basal body P-ring formation protein FlgA
MLDRSRGRKRLDKPDNPRPFRLRRQRRGKAAAILAAMPANAVQSTRKFGHRPRPRAPTLLRMKPIRVVQRFCLVMAFAMAPHAAALAATSSMADERQDLGRLQQVVDSYARKEAAGLPGEVSIRVAPLDSRLSLPHCPAPQAFMPPGGRLWGRSAVGIRCLGPVAWTVYASVTIEVSAEYVVTARPMGQGETVNAQDLATMRGDLARLPAGIVVDPQHAIGKQLAMSLGAGQPLRRDMLRQPNVIAQGQGVKLVSQGPGFQVSTEGRALGNAADGQLVQVRAPSGQTVSGIARSGGIVEIRY